MTETAFVDGLVKHAEATCRQKRKADLTAVCDAGASYGVEILAARADTGLRLYLTPSLHAALTRDLRDRLCRITQSGFSAYIQAEGAARAALRRHRRGNIATAPVATISRTMFRCFPALRTLWRHVIVDWCDSTAELFERFAADCDRLQVNVPRARRKIVSLSLGLSDRHNGGRAVGILRLEHGLVVYKPRSGACDAQWFALLTWLNDCGFSPGLRVLQIVECGDYHWAECVARRPMRTAAEKHCFFVRAGAIACLGYLLRAKDWHSDNLIAERDQPVIVDAEALWHVFDTGATIDPQRLVRDMLLISTDEHPFGALRVALQKDGARAVNGGASVDGDATAFIEGFRAMWRFVVDSAERRDQFFQRLRVIAGTRRRRIHRATAVYASILEQSLRTHALSSTTARRHFLEQRCATTTLPREIVRQEVRQLSRGDIPYFTERGTRLSREPDTGRLQQAISAVRRELSRTQLLQVPR